MVEPSRRTSRLAIAGAAAVAAALLASGFVLGRSTSGSAPAPPVAAPPPVAPVPAPPAEPPVIEPPLGRAELIEATSRAIDAYAAGAAPPEAMATLVGREFILRIPFGCPGAQPLDAGLTARYDAAEGALRLRAEPVQWAPQQWLPLAGSTVQPVEQPTTEAIEGFRIVRPWTSSETCPPATAPGPVSAPPPAPETIGIAQFYTAEGSRVGRRDGEAFEAVERVAPDALDASRGFRLRLRGRIAAVPGGAPVLCRGVNGSASRPTCIVAVVLDEVAFENAADGATLATWDVSSQQTPSTRAPE